MRTPNEHRKAVAEAYVLRRSVARVPDDHRHALARESEVLQVERGRLRSVRTAHRDALERVREQLSRERTYYRRAYEQNRWWIELALRWWEARPAA